MILMTGTTCTGSYLMTEVPVRYERSVPEFIDPRFVKTSPKRSYSVIENEGFGLVFAKTGSIISGTGERFKKLLLLLLCRHPTVPFFRQFSHRAE
jgi:hypothetical protein